MLCTKLDPGAEYFPSQTKYILLYIVFPRDLGGWKLLRGVLSAGRLSLDRSLRGKGEFVTTVSNYSSASVMVTTI